MKMNSMILASAVMAAIALSNAASAQDAKVEKCYGISKAGKNDCQTATSSCAGTAKKDSQKDAFLAVPAGTCSKIVGASLEPKKS